MLSVFVFLFVCLFACSGSAPHEQGAFTAVDGIMYSAQPGAMGSSWQAVGIGTICGNHG
jgi:hypothetical protein